MCSQSDDPTTYDAPAVSKPRAYVLSGTAKTEMEPQPSVALAVIGDMLHEAETTNRVGWTIDGIRALRAARARIAEAEAQS